MDAVTAGFRINWIRMRDADSGRVMWSHTYGNTSSMVQAHIPKQILQCRAVTRQINFSSKEPIQAFKLVQNIYLGSNLIERWDFEFGFVIPGSTNTWEQIIDAAPQDQMLPAEMLSGNLTIVTVFSAGEDVVHSSSVRIFYD